VFLASDDPGIGLLPRPMKRVKEEKKVKEEVLTSLPELTASS
jgi:hypothetical protein